MTTVNDLISSLAELHNCEPGSEQYKKIVQVFKEKGALSEDQLNSPVTYRLKEKDKTKQRTKTIEFYLNSLSDEEQEKSRRHLQAVIYTLWAELEGNPVYTTNSALENLSESLFFYENDGVGVNLIDELNLKEITDSELEEVITFLRKNKRKAKKDSEESEFPPVSCSLEFEKPLDLTSHSKKSKSKTPVEEVPWATA